MFEHMPLSVEPGFESKKTNFKTVTFNLYNLSLFTKFYKFKKQNFKFVFFEVKDT